MKIPLWHKLHQNRLAWAEGAYAQFLDTIDPEIASDFRRQDEVTVVLYGPTQVGKTTLLLKLLGLKEPHLSHVANILRGGRKTGQSATSTAIRYARSPDNNWYLGEAGREPFSDDEMESRLAQLRREVEDGAFTDTEPVRIFIPGYRFSLGDQHINVRVLDLPGLYAANETERELVKNIAKKHVPTADVILLVGRADSLGFLHPDALVLEELQDWASTAQRFRIILTHTVSAESFRVWLKKPKTKPDKQTVRMHMLGELGTQDYILPASLEKLIYPVEYGDSWTQLEKSDPKIYAKAQPFVDELINDLVADIKASATRHGRLRMAFLVHHAVKSKRAIGRAELEAATLQQLDGKSIADKGLKTVQTYVDLQSDMAKKIDKKGSRLKSRLTPEMLGIDDSLLGFANKDGFNGMKARLRKKDSVEALQDYISGSQDALADQWQAIHAQVEAEERGLSIGTIVKSNAYDAVSSTLAAYWWDAYNTSQVDTDMLDIYSAQDESVNAARSLAKVRLSAVREKRLRELERDRKKVELNIFIADANGKKLQKQIDVFDDAISEIARARNEFEKKMSYSVGKAEQFGVVLKKAFDSELASNLGLARTASDPATTFLHLCYIKLTCQEFDKLNSGATNV